MRRRTLTALQELLERGQILFQREVHVELGVAVVAREAPYPYGEHAIEELVSQESIRPSG